MWEVKEDLLFNKCIFKDLLSNTAESQTTVELRNTYEVLKRKYLKSTALIKVLTIQKWRFFRLSKIVFADSLRWDSLSKKILPKTDKQTVFLFHIYAFCLKTSKWPVTSDTFQGVLLERI